MKNVRLSNGCNDACHRVLVSFRFLKTKRNVWCSMPLGSVIGNSIRLRPISMRSSWETPFGKAALNERSFS